MRTIVEDNLGISPEQHDIFLNRCRRLSGEETDPTEVYVSGESLGFSDEKGEPLPISVSTHSIRDLNKPSCPLSAVSATVVVEECPVPTPLGDLDLVFKTKFKGGRLIVNDALGKPITEKYYGEAREEIYENDNGVHIPLSDLLARKFFFARIAYEAGDIEFNELEKLLSITSEAIRVRDQKIRDELKNPYAFDNVKYDRVVRLIRHFKPS